MDITEDSTAKTETSPARNHTHLGSRVLTGTPQSLVMVQSLETPSLLTNLRGIVRFPHFVRFRTLLRERTDKAVHLAHVSKSYLNTAFFRRVFKRCTGLTPGQYRQMFRPIVHQGERPKRQAKDCQGPCKRELGLGPLRVIS